MLFVQVCFLVERLDLYMHHMVRTFLGLTIISTHMLNTINMSSLIRTCRESGHSARFTAFIPNLSLYKDLSS